MLGRWEVGVRMGKSKAVSLEQALDVVSPKIVHAVRAAHEALERLRVRHVLCGGLAASLHGRARATKDVDFLVGDEAFETSGLVVSFKPGIPLAIDGVPIDSVSLPAEHRAVLEQALVDPPLFDGVPVIAPEYLAYMKLVARRRRDLDDVAEMLRSRALDPEAARALLARAHDPDALAALELLVREVEQD